MYTEDGKEVEVVEEPSEDIIDKRTGKKKHIPKKRKIINEDGETEDVEELEDQEPTEYDETGKRKPKKKRYQRKRSYNREKRRKKA